MARTPKFFQKLGETSTRARSKKQESRIAQELSGKLTINSGATFGQNDVIVDFCEIEAKTTLKETFSLRLDDWRKLKKKCAVNKMPIIVVDFESCSDSLAVLNYDDLMYLIQRANQTDE